jgi:2-keto-myo-inositol isomerase
LKEREMTKLKFALNHMVAPNFNVDNFLDLAVSLGVGAVELRNDLASGLIADGISPRNIRLKLEERGLALLSINALQRFNDWNERRGNDARELIDFASVAGAKALVLVPANDGSSISTEQLIESLDQLAPLLEGADLIGLVEPLGFQQCTLRSKQLAREAIQASGNPAQFKLVQDTFHHFVAGEPAIFARDTGLVHLSGVSDPSVSVDALLDAHRVLIGTDDLLGNLEQVKTLVDGGYEGYFSFEPFASSVHQSSDIASDLRDTISLIKQAVE